MTKQVGKSGVEGSQSISRAIGLLSIVAATRTGGARLSTIAEQSGLHIATARRILQALVAEGLLAFNTNDKLYNIGPAVFSFAVMGNPWFARREIFVPMLDRIAEMTRDTVLFSMRSGYEAITLERREGLFPIRVAIFDVGTRRPLGIGAGALCILAFLTDAERKEYFETSAERIRQFGVTEEMLAPLIEQTRAQGYAYDTGFVIQGVRAVGVPVLINGLPVATVHVTTVADRLELPRALEVVEMIRAELRNIPGVSFPTGDPALIASG